MLAFRLLEPNDSSFLKTTSLKRETHSTPGSISKNVNLKKVKFCKFEQIQLFCLQHIYTNSTKTYSMYTFTIIQILQ